MYFDAHSDIWSDVMDRRLKGETQVLRRRHLERFRKGGVEGSIFVLWADPPDGVDYAGRTRQIMEFAQAEIAECAEFRIVRTSEEMAQAKRDGVIYIFIGVEGMAAVDDLCQIDTYYDFGARHAMLTWNEVNALGAGAVSGETRGLTELGKKAMRRMQDKGMLVDVSHLNEAGFWDVARLTTKPFAASHSNCKALCDVPRNLSDEQLRAIRDAGGVVGLNAVGKFISPERDEWTAERMARHAAHMIDVMGVEHVGCGFDFMEFLEGEVPSDGSSVKGLASCGEIPGLFAIFQGMGMAVDEMEKIARLNFQRLIKETVG